MKKKKYRVWFWYDERCDIVVDAVSQKQAELKVKRHLSHYGLDSYDKRRQNDRDYGVADSEEL